MNVPYISATKAKWAKIRRDEDVNLLDEIVAMNPQIQVLVQIAFEAGREWQQEHPTASTEFPDYNAAATDTRPTNNESRIDVVPLKQARKSRRQIL